MSYTNPQMEFVTTTNVQPGDVLVFANDPRKSEATVEKVYGKWGVDILTSDNCRIPFTFAELISRKAVIVEAK